MKNQCCVEDANISPQSSCSMILRSACSHKRSSNSSTVKEVRSRKSNSSRRNVSKDNKEVISPGADSCNCSTQIDTLLESSLKELALKSAKKTYSILKESLYSSFELSETKNCKVFETNVLNSLCAKEFNFNQLSSNNSLLSNEHLMNCEEWSDYSSGVESDFSKNSIYAASEMSRNRRFNRSAVTSSRTLSESETEDETIYFNGKSKNKVQDSNHYSMSKQMTSSELHKNSYNLSKNVSSAFGEQQFFQRSSCMLESPHIDVSSVQCN
ncbi:uncharacterized protein LOC118184041 [Stegodyphus dumicola]|uniref:uncharacterized protein LOC118184041 n=1 Tax=Stegodyphus dumicola TaxID=202533 RepID=UPI0015B208AD|nr:uncharacterized protein LOC118184041 [Stegodyphus dumicola]